ncbi:hypothetical protein BDM02DRAFT_1686308 [Thelephora ganbajun]|uniref:Uncharacterized protein n=1 Tax=Thelephora ganbajun TaxID=370292 RepID=A0ACB6ZKY8_THEGA|nr:hypothetical protein BDM02DRAFT_1686308 [Thelephora ganbajun]
MSRRHGSEHKNRRSGWPQSTPNSRTDPTEGHHSLGYHAEDLIFRMSLPQSTFSPQQATNPTRTSGRHRNRPSPTDSHSPTPDSSPSLGELYPNAALFSDGSVSGVQNSTTSPGSEGFAPFQPQHHPMFPQQPPRRRPPPHPNPQPQRVLTAADFLHRRPLSPQPSSSESSGHSRQSSVGSFTHLPPPFPLPAPSTQPIAIPQHRGAAGGPAKIQIFRSQPRATGLILTRVMVGRVPPVVASPDSSAFLPLICRR